MTHSILTPPIPHLGALTCLRGLQRFLWGVLDFLVFAWAKGVRWKVPKILVLSNKLSSRCCRNRVWCPCCRSWVVLVGLRVSEMLDWFGTLSHFRNKSMVLVVFEKHALVECFGSVMFKCTLVECYGRMWWYHMPNRGYGKIWWQHMIVGGMGHALGFVFGCDMNWSRFWVYVVS